MKQGKWKYLIWFLLCFTGFMILNFYFGKKIENSKDYCDYTLYWNLGKSLFKDGNFSILTLENMQRGTHLPIIYGIMYMVGELVFSSETLGFIFCSSMIYSVLYGILIPAFVEELGARMNTVAVMVILGLTFIFWYGLFLYPLSDVMALLFALLACYFLQKQRKAEKVYKQVLFALGGGISIYTAYNIRTIYMFSLAVIVLAILLSGFRDFKRMIICGLGVAAGVGIAGIPQLIANNYFLGYLSIKNNSSSIILSQLKWGLEMQRYETYVGEIGKGDLYPNYGIVFEDPIGIEIVRRLGIEQFNSYGEYFKFIFTNFFDVVGIYFRHFVNALCPCFPELYVDDINRPKTLLALTGALTLYGAGYVSWYSWKNDHDTFIRFLREKSLYILAIILPCMAIIPGAVEARFFYPVFLLIYIIIAVSVNKKDIMKQLIKKWYVHLLLFTVFLLPIWALWGNTFSNMRHVVSLFTN